MASGHTLQNCFRDIWNLAAGLSFEEREISRAQSAVGHQYSSSVFSSKYPYVIFPGKHKTQTTHNGTMEEALGSPECESAETSFCNSCCA